MKCPKCTKKVSALSILNRWSKKPLQCKKCYESIDTERNSVKCFFICVPIVWSLSLFAKGVLVNAIFWGIGMGVAIVYSTEVDKGKRNQYSKVIGSVLTESIKLLPISWRYGTLNIVCDGNEVSCNIINSEDNAEVQNTDKLRDLCEDLYVLMVGQGDVWSVAKIKFLKENGSWKHSIKFY